MDALVNLSVSGCLTKTVSSTLKGDGRWRMLSRSALEVNVKDPSYFSLKRGPAGKVKSNLIESASVKMRLVGGW